MGAGEATTCLSGRSTTLPELDSRVNHGAEVSGGLLVVLRSPAALLVLQDLSLRDVSDLAPQLAPDGSWIASDAARSFLTRGSSATRRGGSLRGWQPERASSTPAPAPAPGNLLRCGAGRAARQAAPGLLDRCVAFGALAIAAILCSE
jgi:hypothetical protein